MFTFPIIAVRKIVERGVADAAAHGGFRNPYYGTRPGEGEKPGLWLVGDEGVYIMSNGKLAAGSRPSSSMPSSATPGRYRLVGLQAPPFRRR